MTQKYAIENVFHFLQTKIQFPGIQPHQRGQSQNLSFPLIRNFSSWMLIWFSHLWFHFHFLPTSSYFTHPCTVPLPAPHPIHHCPDYANKDSFMSSVVRIFLTHRYVKSQLLSLANCRVFSPVNGQYFTSPQSWPKYCTIFSHRNLLGLKKIWVGITVPANAFNILARMFMGKVNTESHCYGCTVNIEIDKRIFKKRSRMKKWGKLRIIFLTFKMLLPVKR